MTYRELLNYLNSLSDAELCQNVTVLADGLEYYQAIKIEVENNDVVENTPVIFT